MNKNRFSGKNVVITGGSSGIGLAIAQEFGNQGAHLFLVARNKEKLEEAKKKLLQSLPSSVEIELFQADVSVRPDIEEVIHTIGHLPGGIHTLINNAGTGLTGKFEDIKIEDLRSLMDTNYWSAVYATQAALPYLKKSGKGHIGFVGSVGGYMGAIGYSSYAPTKFAMTGLAECIRMEAKDAGIGTTIVFPPDTDTPLWHWEQAHTLPECKAFSKTVKLMSPQAVARKFMKGIEKNRFEVLCNSESKLMRWIKTLFPSYFYKMIDGIVEKDRKQRAKSPQTTLTSVQ